MTSHPDTTSTARRSSGGDAFRAKLTDLDWVRTCGPVELRQALHALLWRLNRDTVDGFCTDTIAAERVLITIRGVKAELDSRAKTIAPADDAAVNLTKRISRADTVITACQVALDLHRHAHAANQGASADVLAHAIVTHRGALHGEPIRAADTALWQALDIAGSISQAHHSGGLLPPIAPMPATPPPAAALNHSDDPILTTDRHRRSVA